MKSEEEYFVVDAINNCYFAPRGLLSALLGSDQ